jgi:hypothetical protein
MLVVVRVDFRMTFKAHRNSIFDRVRAILGSRNNVIQFHLHAAESVTDAAAPVAGRQERRRFLLRKRH